MRIKSICLLFCLVCIVSLSVLGAPITSASGPSSIPPFTVSGTTITASFSYPDGFHFTQTDSADSDENIAMSISVTFNNASVSAVNITEVYLRLYDVQSNVTDAALHQEPQTVSSFYPQAKAYAYANWYSSQAYSSYLDPPYQLKKEASGQTVSLDISPIPLSWCYIGEYLGGSVQARVFVELRLCLIDNGGNVIWFNIPSASDSQDGQSPIQRLGSVHFLFTYYTGEGETPYVTVYPPASNIIEQPMVASPIMTILLVAVVAAVVAAVVGVLVLRRRKSGQGAPLP